MNRLIQLTVGYFQRDLQMFLAWRSFIFFLVLGQVASPLVAYFVWAAALPGRPGLAPYFLGLLLTRLLTVSYEEHTFSARIYSGELADDLLRPAPVVLVPIGANLAMKGAFLLFGSPILALALWWLGGPGLNWLAYLPAVALAALLRFLFIYTLSLTAFWTERAQGAVLLGNLAIFLLGGEAAPLALFPEALQPWVASLPFYGMLGYPAALLAGEQAPTGLLLQALWCLVLALVASEVWRLGVRKYAAVGG